MSDTELATLEWYIENGVTDILEHMPVDKTAQASQNKLEDMPQISNQTIKGTSDTLKIENKETAIAKAKTVPGTAEAKTEAEKRALAANTLDELKDAISSFEGLSVKKTALNIVFSDGDPKAAVMVIGEAPGADEDRQGKPFVGASGQLLDRIFGYVGYKRFNDNHDKGLYISNILNWRPPGNRTPTPAEMSIALPFIERHIQLVKPKLLILVGNTPMRTVLNTKEGIMKMRGRWHDYLPVTEGLSTKSDAPIPTMPTFHPAFLLRNPMHKKTIWQDMIQIRKKCEELGLR